MVDLIGSRVYLQASGLQVACVILATKNAYGHARVELAPVSGGGRAWVDASKVQPIAASSETFALCAGTTCQKPCQPSELIPHPTTGLLFCPRCAAVAEVR